MKILCRTALIILMSVVITFFPPATSRGEGGEILVFVAASLTDAMKELKGVFEEQTGDRVFFSFGSSGSLYRQIEKGAPADVFISASTTQADALELDGLVMPDTRADILTNSLVVIVHRDSRLKIEQLEDLLQQEVRKIAIGEPGSVPAGAYAREALKNLGLWDDLHPRFVPALDVRAVLAYVEGQSADVGIVYKTDALISEDVKVVYEFPEKSHTRIIYPAVILKDTGSESVAGAFVDFLSSAEAADIFGKYGFKTAGGS